MDPIVNITKSFVGDIEPLDFIYSQIQKAKQDSVTGALFHAQDLSNMIYLNGAPNHLFMKRLKLDNGLKGNQTHYWDEIEFASVVGTSSYFYEGDAPSITSTTPTRMNNTLFQVGRCAQVTDKQAALFNRTFGGGRHWTIHGPGNLVQAFSQEMELQMRGRIQEVMATMSHIFINGDKTTTIAASLGRTDVECDGMFTQITNNAVDGGAASITDTMLIDLAEDIEDRQTGRYPQILYVNTAQKKIINTWATNIWFGRNRSLEAGRDVSTFDTGFFVVKVDIDHQIPTGSCAMIDHSMWWKMDLLPFRTEKLAKVDTSIKKMVTYYGTLKCGNDRSSGKITNLAE